MKKMIIAAMAALFTISAIAQDVAGLVEKYEKAVGAEKLKSIKTLKITGTMNQMGMTFPLTMLEKSPDKVKVVSTVNGVDLVQVVNGNQGYMINPMMGSNDPVELPVEQVNQIKDNRMLRSSLKGQLDAGKLSLEGEETINEAACFKIKSVTDAGDVFIYIDKESYNIVATGMSVNQMGMDMNVMMHMSDFKDIDGVIMPMKIETMVNGQPSGLMEFKSVEFDVAIDDSEFDIK